VALTCISALVTLAYVFGHPLIRPTPLGRDEIIGQVVQLTPQGYLASYSLPSNPDFSGVAIGTSPTAAVGQAVVVRYNPANPAIATVVSLTPPHSRPNGLFGAVVVSTGGALALWSWISFGHRRWRRLQERAADTDYRRDEWAGSSNSA